MSFVINKVKKNQQRKGFKLLTTFGVCVGRFDN